MLSAADSNSKINHQNGKRPFIARKAR